MYWYKKYPPTHKKDVGSLLSKVFVINDLHFRANTDGDPDSDGAIHEGLNRYYYASPNLMRSFVDKVNEEKPDLVLALGDLCDQPSDWPLFNDIWNDIDPTIPKYVTIGNHDLDVETYEQLLPILGYDNEIENGGSKFNQTYKLNDNHRIVMIDTTFDDNDDHGNHSTGVRMHSDCLPWLENILLNSEESNILIFQHVGVQRPFHYHEGQREEYRQMINNVLSIRPNLKIESFFGHHHVVEKETYATITGNTGFLLPAMVMYEDGRFTELQVFTNKTDSVQWEIDYEVT